MTLADKLTDGAGADIWTDAPECAETGASGDIDWEGLDVRMKNLREALED